MAASLTSMGTGIAKEIRHDPKRYRHHFGDLPESLKTQDLQPVFADR